jgi:hypothetical protein
VDRKTKALFREIMREIGCKGGKIGGKRSLGMCCKQLYGLLVR